MSVKRRDNKNRWRNKTVAFRVSPEENDLIRQGCLRKLPKVPHGRGINREASETLRSPSPGFQSKTTLSSGFCAGT